MDKDKFLHDILANGIEQPSASFTAKVLNKLARQNAENEEKIRIPATIIWLSVLFPVLSLMSSLKPVYSQLTWLHNSSVSAVLSSNVLICLSLGILFVSLLDIFLRKMFVKTERESSLKELISFK